MRPMRQGFDYLYRCMKTLPFLSLVSVFAAWTLHAAQPEVSNVAARQLPGTKIVEITYDLADADGDPIVVGVEFSPNGGRSFPVPVNALSGDFGAAVTPGAGKKITWDAGIDWNGEYSEEGVIRLLASDRQGVSGLRWTKTIPAGGFWMGSEENGRRVTLNYTYRMTATCITVGQFLEFLELATAAGWVSRGQTTAQNPWEWAERVTLVQLSKQHTFHIFGDGYRINDGIEPNDSVRIFYLGAAAFCLFYGYDLPTSAEWEKAMRGPDHDDLGEHQIYPWGNDWNNGEPPDNWQHPYGIEQFDGGEFIRHPDYLRESEPVNVDRVETGNFTFFGNRRQYGGISFDRDDIADYDRHGLCRNALHIGSSNKGGINGTHDAVSSSSSYLFFRVVERGGR